MDVFTAISQRKSIRAYQDRKIDEATLSRVLEAGRIAPSAGNRQDWKFIVVTDGETRKKLAMAARGQMFLSQAPVVIAGCAIAPEYVMACGQSAGIIDVSIAFSFMMLQATELGLGTCWLGAFNESEVREILGVPDHVRVVAMTPLGYPDEVPAGRPRKSLEEVVCRDRYQG
ncbi:MAG: nitroreductase family protein [Methanocella sp.]